MIRKELATEEVMEVLQGSFAITSECETDGTRHVELEGGNGRQVQIRTEVATGKTQAWLLLGR